MAQLVNRVPLELINSVRRGLRQGYEVRGPFHDEQKGWLIYSVNQMYDGRQVYYFGNCVASPHEFIYAVDNLLPCRSQIGQLTQIQYTQVYCDDVLYELKKIGLIGGY